MKGKMAMTEMNGLGNIFSKMQSVIKKFDANGDGKTSASEMLGALKGGTASLDGIDPALLSAENKAKLEALQADADLTTEEAAAAGVTEKSAEAVKTSFGNVEELCSMFNTDGDHSLSEDEIYEMQKYFEDAGIEEVTINGKTYVLNFGNKGGTIGESGTSELFICGPDAAKATKGQKKDGDIMITSLSDASGLGDNGFSWTTGNGGRFENGEMHFDSLQEFQDYMEKLGSGAVDGVISEAEIQATIDKLTQEGINIVYIDGKAYDVADSNGISDTTEKSLKNAKDPKFNSGTNNDLVLAIGSDAGKDRKDIDTGAGDDIVIAYNVGDIKTGDGDDAVIVTGAVSSVTTGDGEDYVKLNNDPDYAETSANGIASRGYKGSMAGGTIVNTGDDEDTLEIYTDNNTIDSGDGDDEVSIYGNGNKVTTGRNYELSGWQKFWGAEYVEDNDKVNVYGADNDIHTGNGEDMINVYSGEGADNDIYAENGNDDFNIYAKGDGVLDGGKGSDDYWLMESVQGKITDDDMHETTPGNDDTTTKYAGYTVDGGGAGDDRFSNGYESVLTTNYFGNMEGSPIKTTIGLLENNGIDIPDTVTTQAQLKEYLTGLYGTAEFDSLPEGKQNEIRQYLGLHSIKNGEVFKSPIFSQITNAPCEFIRNSLSAAGIEIGDIDANGNGRLTKDEYVAFLKEFVKTTEFTNLTDAAKKAINEYMDTFGVEDPVVNPNKLSEFLDKLKKTSEAAE